MLLKTEKRNEPVAEKDAEDVSISFRKPLETSAEISNFQERDVADERETERTWNGSPGNVAQRVVEAQVESALKKVSTKKSYWR